MMFCSTCSRDWDSAERCPDDGTLLVDRNVVVASGQLAVAIDHVADEPSEELSVGTTVGEYQIERLIGTGGMGMVYAARHLVIGKRAAIKVLGAKHCADRAAVARFVQEAQVVNQIGHGNIVDVFAFGTLGDGRSYLVMELLRGETLQTRLERAPMSVADAIPIIVSLTRALEAAHGAGVIHRDLKPENVFLVEEDEGVRVKLLDFGIAKLSASKGASVSRTATGTTFGTPLYMSPEQARGMEIDARTDLYSLGVLAYQMVCGVTPFEGEASVVEVMTAHITKPPRQPSQITSDLPAVVDTTILELLAKDPTQRPTLQEVRRRLTRLATNPFVGGPVIGAVPVAPPTTPTMPFQAQQAPVEVGDDGDEAERVSRRGWFKWVAVATALCGAVVVWAVTRDRETPTSPRSLPTSTAPTPMPRDVSPPPLLPSASMASPSDKPGSAGQPEIAAGILELSVHPPTTAIVIDGRAIELVNGKARVELAPGSYHLVGTANGYQPLRQRLDVVESRTVSSTIRLRPRAPRAKQNVEVDTGRSTDEDAVVDPFAKRAKQP